MEADFRLPVRRPMMVVPLQSDGYLPVSWRPVKLVPLQNDGYMPVSWCPVKFVPLKEAVPAVLAVPAVPSETCPVGGIGLRLAFMAWNCRTCVVDALWITARLNTVRPSILLHSVPGVARNASPTPHP